jgi:DNA-binding NtrC family response regulator
MLVPPLRERAADIPFLAEQFMNRFVRKHGVRVAGFSAACLHALQSHTWPGNVRELQNVIERGVILCGDGEELRTDHLGLVQLASPASAAPVPSPSMNSSSKPAAALPAVPAPSAELPLAEIEKRHILQLLESSQGNRTHAARKLGISVRTLRNKLNEYGLASRDEQADDPEAARPPEDPAPG